MGGGNCLGSNYSQIYPHMRAKSGRGPTVVSKRKGGGTDRHTHNFIIVDDKHITDN